MNHIATLPKPSATRINEESYEAFRVSSATQTSRVEIPQVDNLKEAVAAALLNAGFDHKEQLIIRESLPEKRFVRLVSKRLLHIYTIRKRSAANYIWDKETHTQKRVQQLYEAHICTVDERVLAGEAFHSGALS